MANQRHGWRRSRQKNLSLPVGRWRRHGSVCNGKVRGTYNTAHGFKVPRVLYSREYLASVRVLHTYRDGGGGHGIESHN